MYSNLHLRLASTFAAGLALLILASCGGGEPTQETYSVSIDPADFVAQIDNPYYPLTPGTTFIYEGETGEGRERVETTVTRDTKVVMGVTCTVIQDRVLLDGELIEETFDWYAQDVDGNVWYFGEDSKDYENGQVISTKGSWEAGVDGAMPGIIMPADPQVGASYRQEYYAGEAEDMAEVLSLDGIASVPYGTYQNLLVTKDWTPLESGFVEQKYYARGVGLVLEEVVQGGEGRIELIVVKTE